GLEAGPAAVDPAAVHGPAENHHAVAVTVVRAAGAVFGYGPPELGHRQDDDVLHAVAEVVVERANAVGQLGQSSRELAVQATLVGVRVPAVDVGERDLQPDVGLDELRDLPE